MTPARSSAAGGTRGAGGAGGLRGSGGPGGGGEGVLLRGIGGEWPRGLDTTNPVIQKALVSPQPVTLAQIAGWSDLARYQREILHLAFRIHARWGRSRLVLVVRDLPFAAFSPTRIRGLAVALNVATRAYRRARLLRRLRLEELDAQMTQASSLVNFNHSLNASLRKARAQGGRGFLVKIRVAPTLPATLVERRQWLRDGLARFVRGQVKKGKLIAHMYRRGALTILCPEIQESSAQRFCDRLQTRLLRSLASGGEPLDPAAFSVTLMDLEPREFLGGSRRDDGR